MRCGLVRLVTRKTPYDVKLRRKACDESSRLTESGALCDVAESRIIGRCCAHKMCRLVSKSSKYSNKVLLGNDIPKRKSNVCKVKNLGHKDQVSLTPVALRINNYNIFRQKNQNSKTKSENINEKKPYDSKEQFIKPVAKIRKHISNVISSFTNHRTCKSTEENSSDNIYSKLLFTQSPASKKNQSDRGNSSNTLKLKLKKNPFLTKPNYNKDSNRSYNDDTNYSKNAKQTVSDFPKQACFVSGNHTKSNFNKDFLDQKVINHLNETSNLSYCGCEVPLTDGMHPEVAKQEFEMNSKKKFNAIFNYCKNKYLLSHNYFQDRKDKYKPNVENKKKSIDNRNIYNEMYNDSHFDERETNGKQDYDYEDYVESRAKVNNIPANNINYRVSNNHSESKNSRDTSRKDAKRSVHDRSKIYASLPNYSNYEAGEPVDQNASQITNHHRTKHESLNDNFDANIQNLTDEFHHQNDHVQDQRRPSNRDVKPKDKPSQWQYYNSPFSEHEDLQYEVIDNTQNVNNNVNSFKIKTVYEEPRNNDINNFIISNVQKHNDRNNLPTKGPDYSIQQSEKDGSKKDMSHSHEKSGLKETFRRNNYNESDTSHLATYKEGRNLSRYSQINLAIEKVKKKINDIVNDEDEATYCQGFSNNYNQDYTNRSPNEPSGYESDPTTLVPNNGANMRETSNNDTQRAHVPYVDYDPFERKDNYVKREYCKKAFIQEHFTMEHKEAPSSIYLFDIIDCMKGNRPDHERDKYDFGFVTPRSKTHKKRNQINQGANSGFKGETKSIQFNTNMVTYKPGTELLLNRITTETLLQRASLSCRSMCTDSKNKLGLKTNRHNVPKLNVPKLYKDNFMDGTIFASENFISEAWKSDELKKLGQKKSFVEYMERRIKGEGSTSKCFKTEISSGYKGKGNEQKFTKVEYLNVQKDYQEKLNQKSLQTVAQNNSEMELKKTEYGNDLKKNDLNDKKNSKVPQSCMRERAEEDRNVEPEKRVWTKWNTGSAKSKTNTSCERNIDRSTMCKCDYNDSVNSRSEGGKRIIFNEGREERNPSEVQAHHANCTPTKPVMNNIRELEFDHVDCHGNNRSSEDNFYCINVGDVGLNLTLFGEKKDEKAKINGKGGGIKQNPRDEVGEFSHASESKINNRKAANMTTSKEATSHLQESNSYGSKRKIKNELSSNTFSGRNPFSYDANCGMRTLSFINTQWRRHSGDGGSDDAPFKTNFTDKLKDINRIDRIDYSREDKKENKDTTETVKIKEMYGFSQKAAYNNENSGQEGDSIKQLDVRLCSKEYEKNSKYNPSTGAMTKVGDKDIINEMIEELQVSGLSPEGKKSVHGKMTSLIRKPRRHVTAIKNAQGRESELLLNIPTEALEKPVKVVVQNDKTENVSKRDSIRAVNRRAYYVGDTYNRAPTGNDDSPGRKNVGLDCNVEFESERNYKIISFLKNADGTPKETDTILKSKDDETNKNSTNKENESKRHIGEIKRKIEGQDREKNETNILETSCTKPGSSYKKYIVSGAMVPRSQSNSYLEVKKYELDEIEDSINSDFNETSEIPGSDIVWKKYATNNKKAEERNSHVQSEKLHTPLMRLEKVDSNSMPNTFKRDIMSWDIPNINNFNRPIQNKNKDKDTRKILEREMPKHLRKSLPKIQNEEVAILISTSGNQLNNSTKGNLASDHSRKNKSDADNIKDIDASGVVIIEKQEKREKIANKIVEELALLVNKCQCKNEIDEEMDKSKSVLDPILKDKILGLLRFSGKEEEVITASNSMTNEKLEETERTEETIQGNSNSSEDATKSEGKLKMSDSNKNNNVNRVDNELKESRGEAKYEIDTPGFLPDKSDVKNENEKEKLIVTHFKQFSQPDKKVNVNVSNVYLEASMLRVTVIQDQQGNITNRQVMEVKSVDNLSDDVENELNEIISPYLNDVKPALETKFAKQDDSDLDSKKEYFMNMAESKYSKLEQEVQNFKTPEDGGIGGVQESKRSGEIFDSLARFKPTNVNARKSDLKDEVIISEEHLPTAEIKFDVTEKNTNVEKNLASFTQEQLSTADDLLSTKIQIFKNKFYNKRKSIKDASSKKVPIQNESIESKGDSPINQSDIPIGGDVQEDKNVSAKYENIAKEIKNQFLVDKGKTDENFNEKGVSDINQANKVETLQEPMDTAVKDIKADTFQEPKKNDTVQIPPNMHNAIEPKEYESLQDINKKADTFQEPVKAHTVRESTKPKSVKESIKTEGHLEEVTSTKAQDSKVFYNQTSIKQYELKAENENSKMDEETKDKIIYSESTEPTPAVKRIRDYAAQEIARSRNRIKEDLKRQLEENARNEKVSYRPYEKVAKPAERYKKEEPTYIKNLRTTVWRNRKAEIIDRNYDDNEAKFQKLQIKNKTEEVARISECSKKVGGKCKLDKSKWVADMCCSLDPESVTEDIRVNRSSYPRAESPKSRSGSRGRGTGKQSKRGFSNWPDFLIRKKEPVIKQPWTPRQPWKN